MFDNVVRDLIVFGIVIGLAIAGIVEGIAWLLPHLHVTWR
jgi:hypothetical protein